MQFIAKNHKFWILDEKNGKALGCMVLASVFQVAKVWHFPDDTTLWQAGVLMQVPCNPRLYRFSHQGSKTYDF
jgi:hypothetical protein